MDLFTQITKVYPELIEEDFGKKKVIELRDDGDGVQYINKWDYSKPIPDGFKLAKLGITADEFKTLLNQEIKWDQYSSA